MRVVFKSLILCLFVFGLIACSDSKEKNKAVEEPSEESLKNSDSMNETTKDEETEEEKKEALYRINEANWSIEPIDDSADEKVVLMTIDDAPDTYALEMAHILKDLDVPAIFFVNGHFLTTDDEKEVLQEIHDLGFVIGNHTSNHQSLPSLSEEDQKAEIIDVNEQVEDVIGEKPVFFRAPFGQNTDFSKQLLKDEEMVMMNWTYGYDWDENYMTKDAIADIMVNAPELQNGSNLLMHDRKWTYEALEDIVKGLQEKGYGFVDPKEIQGYHKEDTEQ